MTGLYGIRLVDNAWMIMEASDALTLVKSGNEQIKYELAPEQLVRPGQGRILRSGSRKACGR